MSGRSQEEKGQGRPRVPDDAEGRSAGHGVQGAGPVGRQGAAGEQDRAHAGAAGGVQEAVQRRRRPRQLQDHVRDRQAAAAHALAPVRGARGRRHVRQLRQQRPVRAQHRPVGRAVPAAGRVPGARQGRRRKRRLQRRRPDGHVVRRLSARRRFRRRAARLQPAGRGPVNGAPRPAAADAGRPRRVRSLRRPWTGSRPSMNVRLRRRRRRRCLGDDGRRWRDAVFRARPPSTVFLPHAGPPALDRTSID